MVVDLIALPSRYIFRARAILSQSSPVSGLHLLLNSAQSLMYTTLSAMRRCIPSGRAEISGQSWISSSWSDVTFCRDSGNALKLWHHAIAKMCRVVAAGPWVSHRGKASNFGKSTIAKFGVCYWSLECCLLSFPSSSLKLSFSHCSITRVSNAGRCFILGGKDTRLNLQKHIQSYRNFISLFIQIKRENLGWWRFW